MKRRRRPSRVPAVLAVLILAGVGGAGVYAWRRHPDWFTSRWRPRAPVAPSTIRPRTTTTRAGSHPKTITAKVHFLHVVEGEARLTAVSREVPAAAPARLAIQELLSGPLPKGALRPLPNGVRVRGLTVRDGLARVDFSRELVANFQGGAGSEEAAVYAIVNTLTSLPGVEKVQILVEGGVCETLGGHLDLRAPLTAKPELVAASQDR